MRFTRIFVLGAASAFVLAACGQQEADPITVEPIYSKYGAASCTGAYGILSSNSRGQLSCVQSCRDGLTASPNSAGQLQCVPPGGGCPPGTTQAAGAAGQCVPIDRGEDPQRPEQPNNPNNPTGAP